MRRLKDPSAIPFILVAVLLIVIFFLYPLANLVQGSFLQRGELTLGNYQTFLSDPVFTRSLSNTLFMIGISTLSATFLGFLFAYLAVRTDVPGKSIFQTTALVPLITPPFLFSMSFILLFGRRGLISTLFLPEGFELYGWHGLWLVQTLVFFPLAYLMIMGTLRGLNPSLEASAHNLGAKGGTVFRTITLPLLTPGILASGLLVSSSVLADFGNPMIIAGNFRVLPTEAYAQIIGKGDYEMGATLCIFLLIPAIIFFFAQDYLLRRKSYITTGRVFSPIMARPVNKWIKWAIFSICSAVVAMIWLLYGTIFLGGVTKTWGFDYSLTAEHFSYAIGYRSALKNSLIFATITGLVCGILGVTIAYTLSRKKFFGRQILDLCSVLPFAIPGTAIGIAFVLAFDKAPLLLHGTFWSILMNMIIREIPIGIRAGKARLEQISPSIDEASSCLGANTPATFRRVILPLLITAFTGGMVYAFIRSINTVSSVIFLVTPELNVATTSILGLAEHNYWGQAAALGSILILMTLGGILLLRLIFGRKAQLFQI